MLKVLLLIGVVLLVAKLFFGTRFRAWGTVVDRFVNLTLILIVVTYAIALAIRLSGS